MPTSVPEKLAAALADRYRLDRPIGQGGMATVYLARDLKHDREVAVKVLRPDLAATIGAERFLREIQISARLQHPHILLLIDSGEADGFLYYVMPFIAGESLRGRLDREKKLESADVLRLARQVGDALEYAHRHGLVHRDIKPENILLSDDHAIVADFGIAKAVTEAADRSLTRTGFPVGTVGYMSPEQAAGFTDLNERSDVFSLACVIYEMLLGRVPGMWPSDESARVERFLEAPAEHRALLDRLPGSVERALVKGLVLRPEQRFAGPRALVDALVEGFGDRKPRYSDRQARAIVARAAELEATAPTQTGALSLGGIQQLGADVGIPPVHVERAARELRRFEPRPVTPSRFLGAPNRISVERVVDGEIEEADYPTLLDEVRMTVGNIGQASTLGRSLAWRTVVPHGQVGRTVHVSITPAAGRTRIRIDEQLSALSGGLFGGLMGGIGGMSVPLGVVLSVKALAMPFLIPVFVAAGLGSSYGLARTLYIKARDKRVVELEDLGDRLEAYLTDRAAEERRRLGR